MHRKTKYMKWVLGAFLLTILLLSGRQVQAGMKPDWDDPDYVKRYGTAVTAGEEEVTPSQASKVDSSKYVEDKIPNKYTGLKYQHSKQFQNCDISYGIDVSKWNYQSKAIDWEQVKADGIEFAFLRIGYSRLATGEFNKDECYDKALEGVKKAKIPFGIYYFSQAITVEEARNEANYVLKLLRDEKLDLPVVFDSERTEGGRLDATTLSRSEYTAINVAFCEIIEAAGYKAVIYNGLQGFNKELNTAQLEDKYEFWFARYNINTYYDGKYTFWQYAQNGKVKGITGSVDVNFWYRPNGTPVPVPEDPAPEVQGVEAEEESSTEIYVSWTELENAVRYEVWRSPAYDGEYERVAETEELSFEDEELMPGQEYYYQVRGVYADTSFSSFSAIAGATTDPEQSRQVITTQVVNLKEHAGAYYETIGQIPEGTLLEVISTTRNVDENVWYQVQAMVDVPGEMDGEETTIPMEMTGYVSSRQADLYIPQVTGVKQSKKTAASVTIKWKAVPGVDGYYIYRSLARNGEFEKIAAVDAGKTTFKNAGLNKYTQYYYRVCGFVRVVDAIEAKLEEKIDRGALSTLCPATTKTTKKKLATTAKIALRKYAGTTYKKLKTIPKKTSVVMDYRTRDSKGDWWYHITVTINNKKYTGFSKASYVK